MNADNLARVRYIVRHIVDLGVACSTLSSVLYPLGRVSYTFIDPLLVVLPSCLIVTKLLVIVASLPPSFPSLQCSFSCLILFLNNWALTLIVSVNNYVGLLRFFVIVAEPIAMSPNVAISSTPG